MQHALKVVIAASYWLPCEIDNVVLRQIQDLQVVIRGHILVPPHALQLPEEPAVYSFQPNDLVIVHQGQKEVPDVHVKVTVAQVQDGQRGERLFHLGRLSPLLRWT